VAAVAFVGVYLAAQWVLPYSLAWARIHITFSIGRALVAALQATGATGLATVAFVLPSGLVVVGGPDAVAVEYQCRATGVRRYPASARWYQTRPQQRHLERVLSAGGAAVLVALRGARGAGKSQLAAAYARQCVRERFD